MPLAVYRRHRRNCKAGHAENLCTSEYDERKKNWKRCECPIFVWGTLAGKFRRRNTGRWEWEPAKVIVGEIEAAGTWVACPQSPPEVLVAEPTGDHQRRITIEHAATAFQSEFQEHAAPATQKKYRLMLEKFQAFSTQCGYIMIDQWGPSDVREFRSSWNVSPQTAPRRMSMLRAFFEYCFSNEWIERNPARLVKNPRSREADRRNLQKLPFTDDELRKMYDACPEYGNEYRFRWKGQDLADFISISVYTGLRISDVALFHIDRMRADTGEILIRTTKTGTNVLTWVPEWLQERIKIRAKEIGPYLFGEHETKSLDVITELWRRKLKKLWVMCGEWKHKPTPHRFRHTFARILLQRGVSVRDVADLLGDTEQMVRKHYSAWVPERQERITEILKAAFQDKPKPKLIALPGGRS